MFRFVMPALALCAVPVGAEEVQFCDPATMNCSPLVVCIEATGEMMRGASFGLDAGPFFAQSRDGVLCEGSWRRGLFGVGLAEFTCSDGRSGQSAFTWFEPESGTAVGKGSFSTGEVARFWAGNNLERYFRKVAPEERQRMACSPEEMLIG
ncbi:hypothetical protein [Rhodobacter calidifons]|uniref:Uncharacterized protein n=1 Tax=Rhodobacter calidifons TaxID=2715277 RepID=A0ABX0G2T3_9RHOB|nr:hypothetical protein [Rhodobacter calidifons]NHB75506.1 hypothetical protein [Rhodobacter calidifons]